MISASWFTALRGKCDNSSPTQFFPPFFQKRWWCSNLKVRWNANLRSWGGKQIEFAESKSKEVCLNLHCSHTFFFSKIWGWMSSYTFNNIVMCLCLWPLFLSHIKLAHLEYANISLLPCWCFTSETINEVNLILKSLFKSSLPTCEALYLCLCC